MTIEWNTEQMEVLNLHGQMLSTNDPRLIRVEGPAASGKSALLQEIASRSRECYGAESVMVLALTNTAADAVGGRTFHRALGLPVSDAPFSPDDPLEEAELELGLDQVKVILIDNVHQVNEDVMQMALRRFQQGRDCGQPFGGRLMVMFGDDVSWGPVLASAGRHSLSVSSVLSLRTTYFKDESFGEAVGRLKLGIVTEEDSSAYERRRLENLAPAEQEEFLKGPKVLVSRDDCADHNLTDSFSVQNSPGPDALSFSRATGSPFERVTLWAGAPVVLTTTRQPGELEAGCQGTVTSVAAGGVLVQFQGVLTGPDSVPVRDGRLPLTTPVAYTVPRAQGLRFDKVLVQLPASGFGGFPLIYAAVSRAKSWDGIAFLEAVPMSQQAKTDSIKSLFAIPPTLGLPSLSPLKPEQD